MFVGLIVLWFEPLVFDFSPEHFNGIEVRAVSWQIPNKQSLFLPLAGFVADGAGSMPSGVVQNQNRGAFDGLGEIIQTLDDKVGIDRLGSWVRAKLLV